ncbi:carbon storage regulator [Paenibacillus psychroresistens]|uniref:Translational regulator CsrA n=1 Tax=Paenibacillus psychroresistens TaxID=1778678 RepID=A0A6B8R976_9BACL|nr:carbon storage regulator CsrA [Paenibacillus psychroresistens]QGQ93521.1 carbon storage regulator [Paenibacillus psychroresistens]
MLVLTRKKSESIMIGDNIELVIVAIEGDLVRIGIKAPKEVEIFRKEVYRSIQLANREAAENILTMDEISKYLKKPE